MKLKNSLDKTFIRAFGTLLLFFLLLEKTLFAQDYFLNIKFSGKLSSNDFHDVGEISADAMIPLMDRTLDVGLFAGDISSSLKGNKGIDGAVIQKTFIGISTYYNYIFPGSRYIPFVGLKGAYLFKFIPDPTYGYYYETTPYSPGFYDHYTKDDFMFILSLGTKIAFSYSGIESEKFIFILGLDYQIRKFNLKYVELYGTEDSDYLSIKYHSKRMNISAIRWSIGLQIDL